SQQRFGQSQRFRRERLQNRIQSFLLIGGGNNLRNHLAISAERITVFETTDLLRRRFGLVAMQQEKRNQSVFELRHGCAARNGVLAKPGESGCSHFQNTVELVSRVRTVVPEVRMRVGAAQGTRVIIGNEVEAIVLRLRKNVIQSCMLVGSRLEL